MNLSMRLILAALTCAITLCSSLAAQCPGPPGAVCKTFDVVSGNWEDASNWFDGFGVSPGTTPIAPEFAIIGDPVFFGTPVVAEINSELTNPIIGDLRVGNGGGAIGTLNHSAGSLTSDVGNWNFLGADGVADGGEASGTYNLSGTASFAMDIGEPNVVDAGTEFYMGFTFVGEGSPDPAGMESEGHLTVADEASLLANRMYVGNNSENVGTVNQSGGSVVVDDWLSIGRETNAVGTYNMTGGSLAVTNDGISVGESTGASGEMNLSNDATVNSGILQVGRSLNSTPEDGGSTGLLTLTGDQVDVTVGFFSMGYTVGFDEPSASFVGMETDGEGTLSFTSASGVSPITVLEDAYLNDGSTAGFANLEVDLETNPVPAGNVLLIEVVNGILTGEFAGLPEGTLVPNSGGRTITYVGGTGNDIYLLDSTSLPNGDFDNNMLYECADVDALVAEIVAGTNTLSFDMNGDMVVDPDDLTAWLAQAGAGSSGIPGLTASGNPVLPGDANLDGTVDGADFLDWNNNKFTSGNQWCGGDFNADGTTDGGDFLIWNGNKFQTADGVNAVPEPAGLLLMLGSFVACSFFRRRT